MKKFSMVCALILISVNLGAQPSSPTDPAPIDAGSVILLMSGLTLAACVKLRPSVIE